MLVKYYREQSKVERGSVQGLSLEGECGKILMGTRVLRAKVNRKPNAMLMKL